MIQETKTPYVEEPTKFKILTSPTGKEIEIVKIANTSLYGFRFVKGGALPKELVSLYTSPSQCEQQIEQYFARLRSEVADEATAKTTIAQSGRNASGVSANPPVENSDEEAQREGARMAQQATDEVLAAKARSQALADAGVAEPTQAQKDKRAEKLKAFEAEQKAERDAKKNR